MRIPRELSVLLLVTVVGLAVAYFLHKSDVGPPQIEIQSRRLVGNEVRLIVATYRTPASQFSGSAHVQDAKGYYVAVDLNLPSPLPQRAQVYGPIWGSPLARSAVGSQSAVAETPMCVVDSEGSLLRFLPGEPGMLACDTLVTTPTAGFWRPRAKAKIVVDGFSPLGEDYVSARSDQIVVQYDAGQAKCFDIFAGTELDDPWLTQSFAHLRSIPDLSNIHLFLTDDLQHLVAVPEAIWNDGNGSIYEIFVLDGKTYNRGAVGLAYSRPYPKPIFFPQRAAESGLLAEPPTGVFSIDGQLYLFRSDPQAMRLDALDGKQHIVATAQPGDAWQHVPFPQIQHGPAGGELVLMTDPATLPFTPGERFTVVRWNYRTNVVTRQVINVAELFRAWSSDRLAGAIELSAPQ